MEFKQFSDAVNAQFNKMAKDNNNELFVVGIDKDAVWEAYLDAFPAGTNELYIERTEHDCSTCRSFVKNIGPVVALVNNEYVTVWDIDLGDPTSEYQIVADKMAAAIRTLVVDELFLYSEPKVGVPFNVQVKETGNITWHHLHCDIPAACYTQDVAARRGEYRSSKEVLQRGLEEFKIDDLETILDLIAQNSLYKGDEFKKSISDFLALSRKYRSLGETDYETAARRRNNFCWVNAKLGVARFRGTAIGTLFQDLAEGKSLDDAVAAYEHKVAPTNYKRPTALITPAMVEAATKEINEFGIEPSLYRRFAVPEDISINNVLFADRSVSAIMKDGLKDLLMTEVKAPSMDFSKVEEMTMEDFISNVIPKINSMEVLFEGKHTNNLMSLIAPKYPDAPKILKWDNNFTWNYNGNVTDSIIKSRVKEAGGSVTGALRVSLAWTNNDDLDLHVTEPSNEKIYFSHMKSRTKGELDIDMRNGGTVAKPAVENVVYQDERLMEKGSYKVQVNNWARRGSENQGYVIEVEYNGEITQFSSSTSPANSATDDVVYIQYDGSSIKFTNPGKKITSGALEQNLWGLTTKQFQKVSIMTISPNHWDENVVGNKHYFFILDKCRTEEQPRGFYNEFLKPEFEKHRKVFEVLGSKTKCEMSDTQLSGLGFSSTKRDSIICKVSGTFNRTLKINF